MMEKVTWLCICGTSLLITVSSFAERIYNEANGLVIMEAENTESPYDGWDFYTVGAAGYPAGATGTGHLEYKRYGPDGWGVPSSPLVYTFKINKAGVYRVFLRAHKRLNPGDGSDQHNDCFVRMEGDFQSGSDDVALSALLTDSKLYGGSATEWSRATNMDAPGADHVPVYYEFKAGGFILSRFQGVRINSIWIALCLPTVIWVTGPTIPYL
ncbi:hypothetical protein EGM51_05510 [Verrucomicrobia bacterium S94]|nr:hypothetical protein EGM51_05510 [Verrucomicrobia bacterium S94]